MSAVTKTSAGWAEFVRGRRGQITRAEFAVRANVSPSYITGWENQGRVPAMEMVVAVALALDEDIWLWLDASSYGSLFPPQHRQAAPPTSGTPATPRGTIIDAGDLSLRPEAVSWEDATMQETEVATDTLHPVFPRGTRLVWKGARTAPKGKVVLISRGGQERMARYAGATANGLLVVPVTAPDLSHPIEIPEAQVVAVLARSYLDWD